MTTYYLNGIALHEDADFTINGMTYPYSWLEGTSPSVRASLGIEKNGDINFDTTYYWSPENPKNLEDIEDVDADTGNPVYVRVYDTVTKQMIDTTVRSVTKGLKTTCTAKVKSNTNTLLKQTDFYILRHEVEETEIPAIVSTYRAAVITESERVVTAIAAATTVEGLISVMDSIAWPEAK
jgi:hypothetical protein